MDSSNAKLCAGFTAELCPKQKHMCTVTNYPQTCVNLSADHELLYEVLTHFDAFCAA